MYPEFLSNPFYIAGESYAGVYVPTLSHEVVKGMAFFLLLTFSNN
jgi:serine carboxypeptidase-like clade 1